MSVIPVTSSSSFCNADCSCTLFIHLSKCKSLLLPIFLFHGNYFSWPVRYRLDLLAEPIVCRERINCCYIKPIVCRKGSWRSHIACMRHDSHGRNIHVLLRYQTSENLAKKKRKKEAKHIILLLDWIKKKISEFFRIFSNIPELVNMIYSSCYTSIAR